MLVIAQPLAIAALIVLAALFLEGSYWLLVLLTAVGLLAVWLGQAIRAHRAALAAGSQPGGELQVVALLPLAVALLAGFWLAGGDLGTPGATLQRYVSAWQNDKPASALSLLQTPADADTLGVHWKAQQEQLRALVDDGARTFGSQSGLDPAVPFNSLRFVQVEAPAGADHATVLVDLVRRERFQTLLLGLIPTAAQRTVVVRRLGQVELVAVAGPVPPWLPPD